MSESVILCEGYHDRAFWDGWLRYLGCSDPGVPPPGRNRGRSILELAIDLLGLERKDFFGSLQDGDGD
ncbi:MAG: hypothetical protein QOJ42_5584 [Acidobacteriaceae bacterium]|jgi:hypothetical protein|nr:hypothetical protein [Acidobacteriaceae bacterium]